MRSVLRNATAALHERLDASMAADLSDRLVYARFLRIQLAARSGIERWLEENAPAHLLPPAMTPLLVDDLTALGIRFSLPLAPFQPAASIAALGVAWVLAGSHLGNRAILAGMHDAGKLPTAFLADQSMGSFWRRLLSIIGEPADPEQVTHAVEGATAVFEHFLTVCEGGRHRLAA